MADRALFLGWSRATVGREQQAMNLWGKTIEYYGQLQAEGKIESWEPVLLSAHGGDLNGFFLIKGDAEKLDKLQQEDTWVDFTIEAEYCLDGFGLIRGWVGEGISDVMTRWSKLISG
jgi:hypothetical protein